MLWTCSFSLLSLASVTAAGAAASFDSSACAWEAQTAQLLPYSTLRSLALQLLEALSSFLCVLLKLFL
jgi:hypothetical protein